jgi:hypothetical protein
MRRFAIALACAAAALVAAVPASASFLVTRDPSRPTLKVDATGHALVSYFDHGKRKNVLLWGAVNALPPTRGRQQVAFKVDFSGGWKALKKPNYYKTIKSVCRRYNGPKPAWYVPGSGCRAPDGSYWALQLWQRMLPNLGFAPWRPEQKVWELHLSHWTGPLPELKVWQDWAWGGQFHQIVGTYTYAEKPIFGFGSTSVGAPTDSWGRNVYLDTLDSVYGAGWKRENSFLAQGTTGRFCYSLGPRKVYPGYPASAPRQGVGKRYRITALGPGVTPIVSWEGNDIGNWDPNDPAKAKIEGDVNGLAHSLGFTQDQCKD